MAIVPFILLGTAALAPAQILARPGWNGVQFNSESWWKDAVFYDLSTGPLPDLPALMARLDALRVLHIDAIILPAPPLPPPGSATDMPNVDALDDLTRQASARGIHVLLTLPATLPAANRAGVARFWLDRGIAGLHISGAPDSQHETRPSAAILGGRLLISDLNPSAPSAQPAPTYAQPAAIPDRRRPSRRTVGPLPALLQLDSRPVPPTEFDAATLRIRLTEAASQPTLLLDLTPPSPALARAAAAIALLTQPAAIIDSTADLVLPATAATAAATIQPAAATPARSTPPQPPPPGTYLPYVPYAAQPKPHPTAHAQTEDAPQPADPITAWYGQLASMHHGNTALRTGTKVFLDFDRQNALVWVSRPAKASSVAAPVVVICNLSPSAIQLSLTSAIKQLNLRGWFLRTLLRSDVAMGAQNLDSISVPAYGVYIGELRR